jgi:hypothetical protein
MVHSFSQTFLHTLKCTYYLKASHNRLNGSGTNLVLFKVVYLYMLIHIYALLYFQR